MDYIYLVILGLLLAALAGDLVRYYKGQLTYTQIFQDYVPKVWRFVAMCILLGLCLVVFGWAGFVPALCWVLVGHLAGF